MSTHSGNASQRLSRLYAGLRRKLFRQREITSARREYERLVREFEARTQSFDAPDLRHFYWYHTVDLGNGLVTPGDYDLRGSWPAFGFPADMRGLKVLDVGSATGYFAFEFEQRGADVVSVELPSLDEWDVPHAEREALRLGMMHVHQAATPEEAYHRHLDGPFRFCREQLGSRVRRCYSNIYELSPEKLGQDQFDLIYAGDILLHLFSPLRALDVLASLCRGTLIISADMIHRGGDSPLMKFLGHQSRQTDSRTWWKFNPACIEAMLTRLGFNNVQSVGTHTGIARRAWQGYQREIFHATK